MSRKRFRPLDAAEAHSVHPEQLLYVGLLDSERSYRFSWPDAPLTLLLAARDALVEADAVPPPHPLAHHPRQPREDGHGSTPRVPLPPVYDMRAMLLSSTTTSVGLSSALAPTASREEDEMDVARLLQPFREQQQRRGGCLVPMPQGVPEYKPHPLAPDKTHRGGSTEDSIFSFTESQWQEVRRCGLLRRILSAALSSATAEDAKGEADDKAMVAAARRAAEQEVVGLEWQAFRESRRTAAALQRLLTLDAAVPFTPCTAALTPSSSQEPPLLVQAATSASGSEAAVSVQQRQASGNEWRYMLYQMWLRWRRPAALQSASDEEGTPPSQQGRLPPWGAPLLAGAFLYGMQPDYFLDTEVLESGGAARRTARVPLGGKAREFASASTSSSADTPLLARAQGAADGGAGERAARSVLLRTAPLPRRRSGAYGFLRWRLDRHVAAAAAAAPAHADTAAAVVVVDDSSTSGTSYGEADALSHTNNSTGSSSHAVGSGGGGSTAPAGVGHGVLGAERVEAMLMQDILTRPLTLLELVDDAEDAEAAWRSLARYDLKRETEAWQSWLSKM